MGFTVQARESLETFYTMNLIGLEVPQQYQALVNRCFDIQIADHPSSGERKEKQQVSLRVRFAPLRPFVSLCNLVITRASGGRWRFDVKLESTEPEVDDTI